MILELDRRYVHHSSMCICCCYGPLGALIFLKTWKVGLFGSQMVIGTLAQLWHFMMAAVI